MRQVEDGEGGDGDGGGDKGEVGIHGLAEGEADGEDDGYREDDAGVLASPRSRIRTITGIDLNHGDIAGYLLEELGLLVDLALFHVNSNRFYDTVPHKFKKPELLFELDLSNNRFA
ncbi:hypothetical protein L484_001013 [Morus notabilis]|uniref:Uncharacterized protein n=1 Tax=Morus notabilis TaxID=981085 RepID=W9S9B5_9ROSA|nr:hypothetical protein L484_001013 [Morus notabilis]